jgi:hypothetical protein
MDQRTLQMIQRGLIAAVSLVLALIVITAFRGLLEPPGETLPLRTTTTTTTPAEESPDEDTETTEQRTTTSTTLVAAEAVCAEDEPVDEDATILRIYFPCGDSTPATAESFVYRTVAPTDLVLTTTMQEMTKGLESEEEELGFRSPFPSEAHGTFLGLSIVDGVAYIEFSGDGIFPAGADTAEGSLIFLSTLNANVFQFSSIDEVEYRLNGSCDAFWQNLGSEECRTITRQEWRSQLTTAGP